MLAIWLWEWRRWMFEPLSWWDLTWVRLQAAAVILALLGLVIACIAWGERRKRDD